ncbi:class I SAM-dependent methyltransferase [Prochlorococcus marinus]|uniref:class I SAM-dependent methyltransferase n=1 Tax=Prochlorococcus marinus TaxID=1219 RepID=UPI001ADC5E19|nr:methyltransferase domain-containing protein [Prochlorococcus marinus]MBO8217695.1 methyltransferase domain-containing protein [Prochlorococcus marinus XMU1405]
MKGKFLETYQKRWLNALKSGDDDIICFGYPDTQVKFFYKKYCEFIYSIIKKNFKSKDIKKLNLLELGCGRGTASIFLEKKLNLKVIGVDFSSESIQIAKNNASKYSSNARFIKGDIFEPEKILKDSNLESKKFDIIISLGVLEHIEDIDNCFKIHFNLMNKNGLFVAMIVPEKKSIQDFFSPLNRILVKINRREKKELNLKHLDRKTLSKTDDVYRSFKNKNFYKNKLEKCGYKEVLAIESNPFPTIRPLNKFLEKILVNTYNLILIFLKVLSRNDCFFNCSTNLSRCHFLQGFKR